MPKLIAAARTLNEETPVHVAHRVVELMAGHGGRTLTVLGWAYKGHPPTDDMRGTPIAAMMPVFTEAGIKVLGHDPLVVPRVIREYGGEPVGLVEGFQNADAVLVITDHPDYQAIDIDKVLTGGNVKVVYDSWRILDAEKVTARGVHYAALGYEVRA